jgi:surface protein
MPAMGPSSVRTMLLRGYAAIFFFSVFSAVLRGNLLLVSAAVRQAPSSKPYYVLPNGVTVVCPGVKVGDTFDINGVTFTRVNLPMLQSLANANSAALSTSCTTGITSMASLFQDNGQIDPCPGLTGCAPRTNNFNRDISTWDTSSVTDMGSMFYVRAPPSRVLLLSRRRVVVVVPHPVAPRSPLTPHGRPSPATL